MPTFLWSGKTVSGQEEVERVTVDTMEDARKIIEARGWTDLRQHTTEITEFVKQQMNTATDPEYRPKLTPKEELAFLQGTDPGFWNHWLKSMCEVAGLIFPIAAYLVWAIYRQQILGMIISGGSLLVMVFLFPVLHVWFGKPAVIFQKLHTARNWRRWDEVLSYLEQFCDVQRSRKVGIAESEMEHYRALALAGLGKVDEAVMVYRDAAERTKVPKWLFNSSLASIYTVAKQYDQGLESFRLAMDEATDKSTVCIDMGNYLVQRFNCPGEARQLLAQVELAQLPEPLRPHLCVLRGAIAFREKDFAAVDRHMREALAGFESNPIKRRYIFEPCIRLTQGYLAASNAALGNRDAARSYFEQSGKYLAAICLDDVLTQYYALMGET